MKKILVAVALAAAPFAVHSNEMERQRMLMEQYKAQSEVSSRIQANLSAQYDDQAKALANTKAAAELVKVMQDKDMALQASDPNSLISRSARIHMSVMLKSTGKYTDAQIKQLVPDNATAVYLEQLKAHTLGK